MELHRGTYTTHARNKRSNRKAEVLYREAEVWNRLALPYMDIAEDRASRAALLQGWKLILLNQFHDIIPGTSIAEAYVTSSIEYEHVFNMGNESLERSLPALVEPASAAGEGSSYCRV